MVYQVVTDAATGFQKYQTGELDVVGSLRKDLSQGKKPEMKASLRCVSQANIAHLLLGQHAFPPFCDVRVRRAFLRAIDRALLVRELLPGNLLPTGLVPPRVPGFPSSGVVPAYDPAAAKAELAAAGYLDGKGFPEIELE